MRRKKIVFVLIALVFVIVAAFYFSNKIIEDAAKGKLYSDPGMIPYTKVGLLLGTSKKLANGQPNPFYYYRIRAAIDLINAKKIRYLIISGDNGHKGYDEPDWMRSDLIHADVDSSIIYLDYAGFRTFDSIKRLKEIFGQDSVTIISQQFHNERAIYLANKEGIYAIGLNAKDVGNVGDFWVGVREKFARIKVFLDSWFGTKPRYLGNKVHIPA